MGAKEHEIAQITLGPGDNIEVSAVEPLAPSVGGILKTLAAHYPPSPQRVEASILLAQSPSHRKCRLTRLFPWIPRPLGLFIPPEDITSSDPQKRIARIMIFPQPPEEIGDTLGHELIHLLALARQPSVFEIGLHLETLRKALITLTSLGTALLAKLTFPEIHDLATYGLIPATYLALLLGLPPTIIKARELPHNRVTTSLLYIGDVYYAPVELDSMTLSAALRLSRGREQYRHYLKHVPDALRIAWTLHGRTLNPIAELYAQSRGDFWRLISELAPHTQRISEALAPYLASNRRG